MSNLVLRNVAGEYWLLDISQTTIEYKKPLRLNEVGASIYTLYAEGNREKEIVEILSSEYDVEGEVLAGDVKAFLEKIKSYSTNIS